MIWPPGSQVVAVLAGALNILDRFHVIAKMNLAIDEVRAAKARRMAQDGDAPVLKKSRWCLLKRHQNLTGTQRLRLRDLLRYNLKSVRLPGGLPAVLELRLAGLGRQVPRSHAATMITINRSCSSFQWRKHQRHASAAPGGIGDFETPSVGLHDRLGDGKAEPGARR